MELGIKVSPMRSPSPVGSHQQCSEIPLSPTGSRLTVLPPISEGGGGEGATVCTVLMQNTCTELKDTMGHLLNQVSSAILANHNACMHVYICSGHKHIDSDCRSQNTESN